MEGATNLKISDEEKIRTAAMFKADGNQLYKEKNYRKAMGKYHRAIIQLKAVGQDDKISALLQMGQSQDSKTPRDNLSPDMKDLFTSLRTDCYNNLAACLLQQESPNYSKVMEYCDQVLGDQPTNSKALHRKGVALFHLKKYEEAQETLLCINNTDAATKRYLSQCKQAIQREEKELQKTYRAMFSGTTEQSKVDET